MSLEVIASQLARNPNLWVGNSIMGMLGYGPEELERLQRERQHKALLERFAGARSNIFKGAGLTEEGGLALGPEAEQRAIASGWAPEAAGLTDSQKRLIGDVTSAEGLLQLAPEQGLDAVIGLLDPSKRRERASQQAYRDAQAQNQSGPSGPTNLQKNLAAYKAALASGDENAIKVFENTFFDPTALARNYELMRQLEAAGQHEDAALIREAIAKKPTVVDLGGGGKGIVTPDSGVQTIVDAVAATEREATLAGATESAETTARQTTEARYALPAAQDTVTSFIDVIDDVLNHEAFEKSVGLGSWNPLRWLPGTPQRDFFALHSQLVGKTYAQAYETLKGGGHITEFEAQSVAQGIAALDPQQSPAQFRKHAESLKDVLRKTLDLANLRAQGEGNSARANALSREISGFKIDEEPAEILEYNPATGTLERVR